MQRNLFSGWSLWSSVSIRLGLSLTLGIVAAQLVIGLLSAASPLLGAGELDTTFGSNGIVTTDIGPGDGYGKSVAIQADGEIVAAGWVYSGSQGHFALAWYTVSGTLAGSFGRGGIVTTPLSTGSGGANAVAIQPDGKIVAAGIAHNGSSGFDFLLARYTPSGPVNAFLLNPTV